MAPIKVGIIGYGFSTKCFHLPFLLPNPDLDVYAFLQRKPAPAPVPSPADDQDPTTLTTTAAISTLKWGHCTVDFPSAKHYMDPEAFFGDESMELVLVLTSDGTHYDFVVRALEAGKHVVVEKPFLNTSAEADQCIALAKQRGRILTVFQNRRFDSDFRTLQHLVHEKEALGEVLEAELHYDHPNAGWIHGWTEKEYTPGQGMLFALGTHTIDQALCLFGRPKAVTGFLRANRGVDSEIDDTFTIMLQYGERQRNLLVTVKTAVVTHLKDQLKYLVRGTKGSYLKFGTDPQEDKAIAAPGKPALDAHYGTEDPRLWGTLTTTTEWDAQHQTLDRVTGLFVGKYPSLPGWYRGYYENMVDAIRGKADILVQPETARDGLRVIELARQSHKEGVTVPWS